MLHLISPRRTPSRRRLVKITKGRALYLAGAIFRLAKAPPCPGPTHRPTPPPFRSLNSSTTRLGSFPSLTYTLTLGFSTTILAWNHASPAGGGAIGFSYCPGLSLRSGCQPDFGCETH